PLQAVVSDGLQVVDIVEEDVFQTNDFRLDVPRHGNVNQQQRAILSEFYDRLQFGPVQNVVGRGSAADDDVDALKFLRPFVKMNGASVQFPRQRFGPLIRAIGNDDAVGATAEQRAGGLFARVSRADDHDVPAFECAENPLREFHGHRTDRHAAALDVGLSANL